MYAAGDRPARRDPARVRVVAYALDDPGRPNAGPYRLITTLLDWERHPARELAALYAQRLQEETALDEVKTHQRGAGVVLASKTPDGIRQRVWAHLLVHHALRALMYRTAGAGGVDCDRLSFTDTLRCAAQRHRRTGRLFPLNVSSPPWSGCATTSLPTCYPPGARAASPASSNASCPTSASRKALTATGPSRPSHPPKPLPSDGPSHHRTPNATALRSEVVSQRRVWWGMIPRHDDLIDDPDHGRAARPGGGLGGHPAAAGTQAAPSRGGRPWIEDRAGLGGIIYVLRAGVPWRLLPAKELGCGSGVTCWRRLRDWQAAGVWEALHHRLLDWLGDDGQVDWARAAIDSVSVRARRRGS
jgi:transposase